MTEIPVICIVFSLYFAFRVPYICRLAPIYILLSQIPFLTFKLYHACHLPSMNCTVVQSSLRPVPVLRNYCFTIIIIPPNYRLSIIFTQLSNKTNGTTRYTSCPPREAKVTIGPRSNNRIPNEPYFHVTLTLRFRKFRESRTEERILSSLRFLRSNYIQCHYPCHYSPQPHATAGVM